MPSFAEALSLMEAWTEGESLRRHMRAVEVALRAYARRFGEDEELWAIAGVLHDMDYEKYPSEHRCREHRNLFPTSARYRAEAPVLRAYALPASRFIRDRPPYGRSYVPSTGV